MQKNILCLLLLLLFQKTIPMKYIEICKDPKLKDCENKKLNDGLNFCIQYWVQQINEYIKSSTDNTEKNVDVLKLYFMDEIKISTTGDSNEEKKQKDIDGFLNSRETLKERAFHESIIVLHMLLQLSKKLHAGISPVYKKNKLDYRVTLGDTWQHFWNKDFSPIDVKYIPLSLFEIYAVHLALDNSECIRTNISYLADSSEPMNFYVMNHNCLLDMRSKDLWCDNKIFFYCAALAHVLKRTLFFAPENKIELTSLRSIKIVEPLQKAFARYNIAVSGNKKIIDSQYDTLRFMVTITNK